MVLDYIQHLISFGGLSILKKYRAHSYRRSSVVLICGLLSTWWHAIDDAVLVRDNVSADVVVDHTVGAQYITRLNYNTSPSLC